jgi:hypothetical protein
MKRLRFLVVLASSVMATEQAFPPSPMGAAELKTLPAGLLLKASASGNYFDQSNRLFGPLFSYISAHQIAMTTPVEAKIEGAAMFFWVAKSERAKVGGSTGAVEVVEIPERWVASLGARGSYTAQNFAKTRDQLLTWLGQRKDVEPAGSPYAVYWNGPFTPGFLKRFEVHVPVRSAGKPRVAK